MLLLSCWFWCNCCVSLAIDPFRAPREKKCIIFFNNIAVSLQGFIFMEEIMWVKTQSSHVSNLIFTSMEIFFKLIIIAYVTVKYHVMHGPYVLFKGIVEWWARVDAPQVMKNKVLVFICFSSPFLSLLFWTRHGWM